MRAYSFYNALSWADEFAIPPNIPETSYLGRLSKLFELRILNWGCRNDQGSLFENYFLNAIMNQSELSQWTSSAYEGDEQKIFFNHLRQSFQAAVGSWKRDREREREWWNCKNIDAKAVASAASTKVWPDDYISCLMFGHLELWKFAK